MSFALFLDRFTDPLRGDVARVLARCDGTGDLGVTESELTATKDIRDIRIARMNRGEPARTGSPERKDECDTASAHLAKKPQSMSNSMWL